MEGDNFLKKLCCFVVLLFEVDNFLKCGVLLVEGYKFLKKPCCCVVLLFEVDNFLRNCGATSVGEYSSVIWYLI